MNKEDVKNALIQKIQANHQLTTGEKIEINENTVPFEELEFFDSLLASEVGIDLQDELECDFEKIKEAFEKAEIEGKSIDEMAEIILSVGEE